MNIDFLILVIRKRLCSFWSLERDFVLLWKQNVFPEGKIVKIWALYYKLNYHALFPCFHYCFLNHLWHSSPLWMTIVQEDAFRTYLCQGFQFIGCGQTTEWHIWLTYTNYEANLTYFSRFKIKKFSQGWPFYGMNVIVDNLLFVIFCEGLITIKQRHWSRLESTAVLINMIHSSDVHQALSRMGERLWIFYS